MIRTLKNKHLPIGITEKRNALWRSTGYTYAKNGTVQQTVTTGYGSDGRIATAGFIHGGEEKVFSYEYMAGTHLLEKLVMPNNMTLTQSYEIQRDLHTGIAYHRGTTLVANRQYSYDTLGRPTARNTSRQGSMKNDIFGYNYRSELTTATVNGNNYAYDYDNIGNRLSSQSSEGAEADAATTEYTANELNQYTAVGDFIPTFDADGNQTLVKTSTGTWEVTYDVENRPVNFTNTETNTVIECAYDHMGRRATKKVTVDGSITLHQRYLYRGYLQIACCDLTRDNHPALWFITWDPTQPIATRPLAIQKDGTWYTYGWDLTKNICELYGTNGYIRTAYTYSPYGEVTASGDVSQPIQWSSEYNDTELGLVYYNYRHYNPTDGRWLGRDRIYSLNSYNFAKNSIPSEIDIMGLYARCILVSEMDLSVDPDTQENIDNITDAISHYRGASGKTVYATDALYNEMKSDPSYKERIFGMKTDSLRSKIMFKLLNVSPKETSGTISAAPNSYIGRLWCLTLGSYKLDIDYNSKWEADSDWKQDLIDVICCRYYRFVKSNITIKLTLNTSWDFNWNKDYSLLKNITQESIPEWIANMNTNKTQNFNIEGEITETMFLRVKQHARKGEI